MKGYGSGTFRSWEKQINKKTLVTFPESIWLIQSRESFLSLLGILQKLSNGSCQKNWQKTNQWHSFSDRQLKMSEGSKKICWYFLISTNLSTTTKQFMSNFHFCFWQKLTTSLPISKLTSVTKFDKFDYAKHAHTFGSNSF